MLASNLASQFIVVKNSKTTALFSINVVVPWSITKNTLARDGLECLRTKMVELLVNILLVSAVKIDGISRKRVAAYGAINFGAINLLLQL